MKRSKMRRSIFCLGIGLSCLAFSVSAETVNLYLKNAPVREVLLSLADMAGKNIVFAGDLGGSVTADLDHVTPEEAIRTVILAGGLTSREDNRTLIVYDNTETSKGHGFETIRLSYANAPELAERLHKLSDKLKVSSETGSNTLLVAGPPAVLAEARRMAAAVDRPEKQVKVEAEVVAVNRSDAKSLGIDWDFQSLTGSAEYERESWSEQRIVTDEAGNIKYDDDGDPKIRNISHTDWKVTAPSGYAGISFGRSVAGHPYTFFFQAKLNALVTNGKAKILAKPNVVTMNGRKAEILIGSRIPVIVEHVENGTRTTATEYKDAGIKLTYTPLISENDEITATIRAEVSTPYLVPEMHAYRIITRQADTMVRLKSGDEIVIGGLIDKETTETFRKVPILGDIPLLGKLFQSKSKSTEESEVIIIIRAELLK